MAEREKGFHSNAAEGHLGRFRFQNVHILYQRLNNFNPISITVSRLSFSIFPLSQTNMQERRSQTKKYLTEVEKTP